MPRITEEARSQNEAAIRAAMDRLLRGEIPPGGTCDLKTLAREAGVPRTSFYPSKSRDGSTRYGPYQHLATEFERRYKTLQAAGDVLYHREAQIDRLKAENEALRGRVRSRDAAIEELTEFKTLAISRLAAQHVEIERLRQALADGSNVRALPVRARK
jgi:hypothetical protein